MDEARRAFLAEHANWDGLRRVYLTFDVDWAPDYMIENVLDILERAGVGATFFATHDSALLRQISVQGTHEVGFHPYIAPSSSQGATMEEVLAHLRVPYPDAIGCRFHILGGSYRDKMKLSPSGIRYDVSTLLYRTSHLQPAFHRDLGLLMVPYFWEDGICENCADPMRLESIPLAEPGLKVINFHPMNVFINGPTAAARLAFIRSCGPLLECPQPVARTHRQEGGEGSECVLRDLVNFVKRSGIRAEPVRELYRGAETARLLH